ncbi:MAG TPA: L,D-transpeptidase family protein [Xanthobacteraceae bacterium]|nr:L,D-transpeptidase family protein [Xanthobacteraceae bacterium]
MTSRILGVIVALGVAAYTGHVSAQVFLPGPPAMLPPGDLIDEDDDTDDLVEAAPQIQSQPLAPLAGRDSGPIYSMPPGAPPPNATPPAPFDPREPTVATAPPIELSAPSIVPARPAPQAPTAMLPRQTLPGQGLRPPGDITEGEKPTASVPGSLPPEYQPEVGQQKELPQHLRRQAVDYFTKEPVGTIIIDTPNTYLYLVTAPGKAMRYGIGVGREGFTWTGKEKITKMAQWPDWFPPSEMIERQPYLPRFMAGGETNPLGARALYLGKTLYRIHGTNQPSTIGTFVSSGCIRLVNDDISDLFDRVKVGTRVVVLPGNPAVNASVAPPAKAAANTATPTIPPTAPAASKPMPRQASNPPQVSR